MMGRFHYANSGLYVFAVAEHLGVARERVLETAGMTEAELPPGPGRIPWSHLHALTRAALDLTAEPALGLVAANLDSLLFRGIPGAFLMHAPSMRTAQTVLYNDIWPRNTNLVRFWHEEAGNLVCNRGVLLPPQESLAEVHLHMSLGLHVAAYRKTFGKDVEIDHIALSSTALDDSARLSRLAGCPVLTGQPGDWVAVPRELVDRHMSSSHRWLRDQLRPQMENYLRMLDDGKDATIAVRDAIEAAFSAGGPTDLATIAERMGWKPRTLRARLAAEGGSFSDILDAQRREVVLKLMTYPGIKLGAVAAQIGFSDPAAFTRAFRRWTGSTPKAWLRQSAAAPTTWSATTPRP